MMARDTLVTGVCVAMSVYLRRATFVGLRPANSDEKN